MSEVLNNIKIEIFDTTLRDGVQGEGISLSVEDKLAVLRELDVLGIDFVEAGNPSSNITDVEFFKKSKAIKLCSVKTVAFGSTRRKDISCENDRSMQAMITSGTDFVSVFGKCWDMHVEKVLGTMLSDNLNIINSSCKFLCDNRKNVIFDAEHFFDGYKANPKYAIEALSAASDGGAQRLVLCDTNGGCFPHEIEKIVSEVVKIFPNNIIGVHCHNDTGCAVACTIAGVLAGARHVQGTYLGFGERCGNASLFSVIAGLQLKLGFNCIPAENLNMLKTIALRIAEIANTSIKRFEPYIGSSAFAHKAGMHTDGVLKISSSFEHINPETVGNERRLLVSQLTGKAAVLKKISTILPYVDCSNEDTKLIIEKVKHLEHDGYQFEGADASFEILVLKVLNLFKNSFELVSYKVLDELPYDSSHSATATIKIKVNNTLSISAAEGDGPINALDSALRKSLVAFYPSLKKMHLADYKVRVIDSKTASAANVRVLITSTDGQRTWSTVGVSKDIIEASWFALVDSIEYILKDSR